METWEPPKFPVNDHDLMAAGCPKGRMMSVVTSKLREVWKESDFLASKDALLAEIPRVLDEVDDAALAASPKMSKKERKAMRGLHKKAKSESLPRTAPTE